MSAVLPAANFRERLMLSRVIHCFNRLSLIKKKRFIPLSVPFIRTSLSFHISVDSAFYLPIADPHIFTLSESSLLSSLTPLIFTLSRHAKAFRRPNSSRRLLGRSLVSRASRGVGGSKEQTDNTTVAREDTMPRRIVRNFHHISLLSFRIP